MEIANSQAAIVPENWKNRGKQELFLQCSVYRTEINKIIIKEHCFLLI